MNPGSLSRRAFGRKCLAAGLPMVAGFPFVAPAASSSPRRLFNKAIRSFMKERAIPGGALAVLKDNRLVHVQAYGYADRKLKIPIKTSSRFRIASLSKPITALAILKLLESDKLQLDQPVADYLNLESLLPKGRSLDARWNRVSIRHLLHHTGGWDRDASFDPMFRSREIARHFDLDQPADPWHVIRYMLEHPLDFQPGERYAYSNFGYCLLGRVIEKASGNSYEAWVRSSLLEPLGLHQTHLGLTQPKALPPEEVRYYMPNEERSRSVFPGQAGTVPWPYGGFWLEAMDAHGGWTASVLDLARLTAALLHPPGKLIRPQTLDLILQPPVPPAAHQPDGSLEETFYGLGWMVRPRGAQNRPNLWHTGSLPGTFSLWVRRGDGISYVALFNQRSQGDHSQDNALDPILYEAANAVTRWPEGKPL